MGVFKYQSPERALFGFGSLQGIQDEIRSRKLTKALLVTGRDLADTAIVKMSFMRWKQQIQAMRYLLILSQTLQQTM